MCDESTMTQGVPDGRAMMVCPNAEYKLAENGPAREQNPVPKNERAPMENIVSYDDVDVESLLGQWEGLLFLTVGAVGQDRLGSENFHFSNGTILASYDYINGRSYVAGEVYTKASSSPTKRSGGVIISHYKTGTQYQIYPNRTCVRIPLTDNNMTTYCGSDFPANRGFPVGRLAGVMPVMNLDIVEGVVFAAAYQDASQCMPVFVSSVLMFPGMGLSYGADILDIREGIQNPDIFNPPSYCPKQFSVDTGDDMGFPWLRGLFHSR